MDGSEILEIARDAIVVMLMVGAPLMIVALIVGVSISLLQALTQIQEMTITFVPKILIMLVSFLLLLPFMAATLDSFTRRILDRIVHLD
jgi:flagellar biosynthesis protein FliQ